MELGANNDKSDGALLDHATVVVLLVSAHDAAADGAATAGIMLLCLAWSSVRTMERQMVHCLAMLLLWYCLFQLIVLLPIVLMVLLLLA